MLQKPTPLEAEGLKPRQIPVIAGWCSDRCCPQWPQGLRPGKQLPALTPNPQHHGSRALVQALHRQARALQHLPNGNGGSALCGSVNAVRHPCKQAITSVATGSKSITQSRRAWPCTAASLLAIRQLRASPMAGLRQGRETSAAPWPPEVAAGHEAKGGPASAHCRAKPRGETTMPQGHGTNRPCETPLGCLRGAAPRRCPAPERPERHPAAAPRPVAAAGQHRAADQPTASVDAAAPRCS